MVIKLDLGCGKTRQPDFIGIDNNMYADPDIVASLDSYPLPIKDSSVDEIYCNHVLEHLEDPIAFIKEVHRICKAGAVVNLIVPHFTRGYSSFVHKHGFDHRFMHYFDRNSEEHYAELDFDVVENRLIWEHPERFTKGAFIFKILAKLLNKLANASPWLCDRIWCYWFGGLLEIRVKYIVRK